MKFAIVLLFCVGIVSARTDADLGFGRSWDSYFTDKSVYDAHGGITAFEIRTSDVVNALRAR